MTLYETIYKALKERKTTDIKIGDRDFTIEINLFKKEGAFVRLFINESFSYDDEYSCPFDRDCLTDASYNKHINSFTHKIFLYIMYSMQFDSRSYRSQDDFNEYLYTKTFLNGSFVGWKKKANN